MRIFYILQGGFFAMNDDLLILEEILLSWKRCTIRGLIASIGVPMVCIEKNALLQRLLIKKNCYCCSTIP
jgi:hypothetical protein